LFFKAGVARHLHAAAVPQHAHAHEHCAVGLGRRRRCCGGGGRLPASELDDGPEPRPVPAPVLVAVHPRRPATKLLPALLIETNPRTVIVVADDDVVLHPRAVEALAGSLVYDVVAWAAQGVEGAGARGALWSPNPRRALALRFTLLFSFSLFKTRIDKRY
jgi:hypothetical protein